MPNEFKAPKVILKVTSQKGSCVLGHKVGQEFDVSRGTPEGMCPAAYNSAFPYIFALIFGAQLPWEKEKGIAHVACPDPQNPVVMEIKKEE